MSTNFTVTVAPVNSSTTDRIGQHSSKHIASKPCHGCNFVPHAFICVPAVVVLDKAIKHASVYENVSSTCVSGGVCCSNSSATLLAANATAYTAFHVGPQTYRQVIEYQMVTQLPIQRMSLYQERILSYSCATCRHGHTCSSHGLFSSLETFSTVRCAQAVLSRGDDSN